MYLFWASFEGAASRLLVKANLDSEKSSEVGKHLLSSSTSQSLLVVRGRVGSGAKIKNWNSRMVESRKVKHDVLSLKPWSPEARCFRLCTNSAPEQLPKTWQLCTGKATLGQVTGGTNILLHLPQAAHKARWTLRTCVRIVVNTETCVLSKRLKKKKVFNATNEIRYLFYVIQFLYFREHFFFHSFATQLKRRLNQSHETLQGNTWQFSLNFSFSNQMGWTKYSLIDNELQTVGRLPSKILQVDLKTNGRLNKQTAWVSLECLVHFI